MAGISSVKHNQVQMSQVGEKASIPGDMNGREINFIQMDDQAALKSEAQDMRQLSAEEQKKAAQATLRAVIVGIFTAVLYLSLGFGLGLTCGAVFIALAAGLSLPGAAYAAYLRMVKADDHENAASVYEARAEACETALQDPKFVQFAKENIGRNEFTSDELAEILPLYQQMDAQQQRVDALRSKLNPS